MTDKLGDSLLEGDVGEVTMTVDNINYFVKDKHVLKGVTAQFVPNEIVALMGPSGAGKTSLLNVLANRGAGKTEGTVYANSEPVTQELLRHFSNYIPQEDILIAALTPRESLTYTATMRLPESMSAQDRANRVEALLNELSLNNCADTPIGDEAVRGISGGQRKRTSVAQELINNPSVLFVDEPTSGLDSKTANDVIRLLQAVAHRGRTVICSIHQPSKRIFNRFDRFLLLSYGSVIYFGSTERSVDYFGDMKFVLPEGENPPNFFMEILQVKLDGTTFADEWKKRHADYELEWIPVESTGAIQHLPETSFATQFGALFSRGLFLILRDPRVFRTRVASVLLTILLIAMMFPNLGNSQLSSRDKLGFIVLSEMYMGVDGSIQQAIVFPLEKMVVFREYNNGAYSIGAYFASKFLLSVIFQSIYTSLYVMISYPIVGLRMGADHIFTFLLALLILGVFSVGFGFIIGVISVSVMMANILITPQFMMFFMFNGFLINQDSIPGYWYWMYLLNPLNYGLQTMLISQFRGKEMDYCDNTLGKGRCPYGPGEVEGEVLLKSFSIDDSDLLFSILATLFFAVQTVQMGLIVIEWAAKNFKY